MRNREALSSFSSTSEGGVCANATLALRVKVETQISSGRRGNSAAKIPNIRPEVFGGREILLRSFRRLKFTARSATFERLPPILLTVVGMRTVKNDSFNEVSIVRLIAYVIRVFSCGTLHG